MTMKDLVTLSKANTSLEASKVEGAAKSEASLRCNSMTVSAIRFDRDVKEALVELPRVYIDLSHTVKQWKADIDAPIIGNSQVRDRPC